MAILTVDTHVFQRSGRFDIVKLINDGATAAGSESTAIDVREASGITLLVEASSGTSAGVVTIEGAVSSTYTGTWFSLGTATTNAASRIFSASFDNLAKPFPYVRARISTNITSGTVDVYLCVIK